MPTQASRQPVPGKGAGQIPFPLANLSIPSASSQAFNDPRTVGTALVASNTAGGPVVACLGVWIKNAGYNMDGTQNKDDIAVLTRAMPPGATGTVSATPTISANPSQVIITIAPGEEKWVDTDDVAKLMCQRITTLGTRSDAFCTRSVGGQ